MMLVAAAFVVVGGAGAQQGGVIESDAEIAARLAEGEKWRELLLHLKEWEFRNGDVPEIFRLRGMASGAMGDTAAAAKAYARLQELTPASQKSKHLELFLAMGDLHAQTREFGEAELDYRRALAIQESPLTWRKLTDVMLAAAKTPQEKAKAGAALRKTLTLGEYVNDAGLWRVFAKLQEELGNDAETYAALNHVVRLSPAELAAWERLFALADTLGKSEKRKGLIVSRLLRINGGNPTANAYRGLEAERRGDKRMAKFYYGRAVAEGGRSGAAAPKKWRGIAFLGLANGATDNGEALAHYRLALLADPSLLSAWERAVVILRGMGRNAEASTYLDLMQKVQRRLEEDKSVPPELLAGI